TMSSGRDRSTDAAWRNALARYREARSRSSSVAISSSASTASMVASASVLGRVVGGADPFLELGRRAAVVDGLGGPAVCITEPFDDRLLGEGRVVRELVRDDPGGRVEQHDVAHRALP